MQKLVITTITSSLLAASSAVAGDFSQPIAPTAPAATNIGELAVGYNSLNIYRGVNRGNDEVTAAATVNTACPLSGLNLEFGAAYGSTQDKAGFNGFNELNLHVATSKDLGFATAHVGYIFTHFFNDVTAPDNAQEAFFGLSKDLYGVQTSLTYFWDIESDNQGYSELALSKSVNVFGKAIDLGATVGYLVEEGALSHVTVGASHDVAFGNATLTPYIAHVWELDDLERAQYSTGSEQNELIGGVKLSVKF